MPSGWEVYYVVFLSALLALGFPLALSLLSKTLSKKVDGMQPPLEFRQQNETKKMGRSFNPRFFLAANTAVVLLSLILLLIPSAGILHRGASREDVLLGLVSVVSVAGFAAAGLLYATTKGDLSWMKSYRRTGRKTGDQS